LALYPVKINPFKTFITMCILTSFYKTIHTSFLTEKVIMIY